MASRNYVFSTLANDQLYTNWEVQSTHGQDPQKLGHVLVRGGAGVANSHTIVTPRGVVTEVSDDQLAHLEKNPDFQRHKANGFIRVEVRSKEVDKVAGDMNETDKSRPYTDKSPEFNLDKIMEA